VTANTFKLLSHSILSQTTAHTTLNPIHISRPPQVAMASPSTSLAGQLVLSTTRTRPQRHRPSSSSPVRHMKRSNLSSSNPTNNLINATAINNPKDSINLISSNSLSSSKPPLMVKVVVDTNQGSLQEAQLPTGETRSNSPSHTTRASHMLETKISTYLICNSQNPTTNRVNMRNHSITRSTTMRRGTTKVHPCTSISSTSSNSTISNSSSRNSSNSSNSNSTSSRCYTK